MPFPIVYPTPAYRCHVGCMLGFSSAKFYGVLLLLDKREKKFNSGCGRVVRGGHFVGALIPPSTDTGPLLRHNDSWENAFHDNDPQQRTPSAHVGLGGGGGGGGMGVGKVEGRK